MNLSTARTGTRIKEIGVRRVSGAERKDLFKQFLNEAMLLTLLASAVAILIVKLLLPIFNEMSGKELIFNLFTNKSMLLGVFTLTFLTGFISGSYPAIYLSSFNPTGIFKAKSHFGVSKSGVLRKILVVGQFAFAIILISASLVIFNQINYIQNKNLGYDKENLICFASYGEFGRNYETTKNELLQNPDILNVCLAFPPSNFGGTTDIDWEGKDQNQEVVFFFDIGDYDYFKTFNFKLSEGRYYSRKFPSDTANFVVNETAVKVMGFETPIGKRFRYKNKTGQIIGVVKDYHGGSLHSPIMPKVIELGDRGFFVCVKYREGKTAEDIPLDMKDASESARLELVEAAAEGNDTLLEKYLNGGELTAAEVTNGLASVIRGGTFIPVFVAAGGAEIGILPLLSAVKDLLPDPTETNPIIAQGKSGEETLKTDDSGPLAVYVWKTTADPFVGKQTYIKIFSGVLNSDMRIWNQSKGIEERLGGLFIPRGKSTTAVKILHSGDIGVVPKLSETATGNTLCDKAHPLELPIPEYPNSLYRVSIDPITQADSAKISPSLTMIRAST